MQWKDIGETIHMSGKAVGNRIRRMKDERIIKAYTLHIDENKLCTGMLVFLIIYDIIRTWTLYRLYKFIHSYSRST
nr:hypothetical protein [Staphylococcus sp. NAM3COL9]